LEAEVLDALSEAMEHAGWVKLVEEVSGRAIFIL
jgi:hypothetical protein